MPEPILCHLIGYAFLVRYVREGYVLRSGGGSRRHPTGGLLGGYRGAVRQRGGTRDRGERQTHHYHASGQSRKRATDRLSSHTDSSSTLPRHLLLHVRNHTTWVRVAYLPHDLFLEQARLARIPDGSFCGRTS
jgi:hypothetical protein